LTGRSSIPEPLPLIAALCRSQFQYDIRYITCVSEYWIARSSRAMTTVMKYSTNTYAIFEMASRRDAH
jgi:hypothetical protein